jgi:hypothetical protein
MNGLWKRHKPQYVAGLDTGGIQHSVDYPYGLVLAVFPPGIPVGNNGCLGIYPLIINEVSRYFIANNILALENQGNNIASIVDMRLNPGFGIFDGDDDLTTGGIFLDFGGTGQAYNSHGDYNQYSYQLTHFFHDLSQRRTTKRFSSF